jgi:hypothetical protein
MAPDLRRRIVAPGCPLSAGMTNFSINMLATALRFLVSGSEAIEIEPSIASSMGGAFQGLACGAPWQRMAGFSEG